MFNLIKKLKPNLGKYNPGQLVDMLEDAEISARLEAASSPEYLYYDNLRDVPPNMEKEKFWALVKVSRKYSSRPLPPLNFNERPFTLNNLFPHNEVFYKLDNNIFPGLLGNKDAEAKALLDEAIYSAAIEDAGIKYLSTKRLLLENTLPKTSSDILAKQSYKLYKSLLSTPKLSKDLILKFTAEGRFRSEEERFVRSPKNAEMVCYIAPSARIFEPELERFIAFANDAAVNNGAEHIFMHPLSKAILLHFWALILKPLPENNGIFARAIQYWYLQKAGRGSLLLPVSQQIKHDLAGYADAITCAAQDDNDYTYFQDYMLRKFLSAAQAQEKLRGKDDFANNILPSLQRDAGLNQRQAKLVYELCQSRSRRTNFSAYMSANAITRKTAADDLKALERGGYLKGQKLGRNIFYYAAPKAAGLFS